MSSIESVKEYLRSYSIVARNRKNCYIASNVAENIILLLDHCEALEVKLAQLEENRE
ncbi:MAG: hypothetical protein KA369_08410 [Spirochaetes bacterium]|nr:hypothetical protein [Spirochaetota bacterium]